MNTFEEQLLAVTLQPGHTILRSQQHTFEKIECDNLDGHPLLLGRCSSELGRLASEFSHIDGIVTVGNGANKFALPAARIASEILERPIAAITTIKDEENALHLNGPVDVSDMRLVVIDDVHSYSTSIKLVGKLVVEGGASVVGAAVLMNRNPYGVNRAVIAGQEILVRSLIQHPIADYSPEDCPFEAGLGMFEPEN